MAKKPLKPCGELSCNNLTRETYCKTHQENVQKNAQKYDQVNRNPKTKAFYKSSYWIRLRTLAYQRDHGLCQRCLKSDVVKQADVVHHIVPILADWSLRLSLDNLESLCHACHNAEHKGSPVGR